MMSHGHSLLAFMGFAVSAAVCIAAPPAQDYPFRAVPFTRVSLTDRFWAPRIETNRSVTIPHAFKQCEETGRIENFKVAGGLSDAQWTGRYGFNDSDVSKIVEGAAYCLTVKKNPKLDAYLDRLIGYYAAAQEKDGFLYTLWTARHTIDDYEKKVCKPRPDDRWSNIFAAHQLYNVGHMYEAGVAHFRATGKRDLLDVCIRNADLVCSVFRPGGREEPPGHQEIEIGLVRLYRVTGDRKYLDQAKYFLDLRGHGKGGRRHKGHQNHQPVVEQEEAVGHAVRANYMYSAMADVAALTGNKSYIKAIDRLWTNVVTKKLYLTGGVGAVSGGEAYGDNYELPNLTAYCETCAAIANVFWNQRMFLLHGHAKYIDVMERSLYNNVLSGVALDGKHFFYPNPLASDGSHARQPWFGCACCPSNIARFLPSVGGYMYATRDDVVYVNLFAASRATVQVGGQAVKLIQETRYPWDGRIKIAVKPEHPATFTLKVRIPGWARNEAVPGDLYRYVQPVDEQATLSVNGKTADLKVADGYAAVRRKWQPGDAIELTLPMPVRRVLAHENVQANRGRVALQRGPLVYCLEHPDVPGGRVENLVLADGQPLDTQFKADLLGGVMLITGRAQSSWLQDDDNPKVLAKPIRFKALPYYAWAHRGRGPMAVWLPRTPDVADPLPLQDCDADH